MGSECWKYFGICFEQWGLHQWMPAKVAQNHLLIFSTYWNVTKENFKHLCKPGHYKEALYPVTCRSIDLNFTDRGSISMSWVNECATLNTSRNIYCHFCFSTNGSWGLGELKLPYLTSVCLPTKSMFAIWFNPVLSFWANSIVLFSLQFHEMLNLFT